MSQHMISTQAKWINCRCGVLIMSAIVEGLVARVDVKQLSPAEEIEAIVDGRFTYALLTGELAYRTAGRIRGGLVGRSIHAEHRCRNATQPTLFDQRPAWAAPTRALTVMNTVNEGEQRA